jgi:hypothetical protein
MKTQLNEQHADDVASGSAAFLFDLLPAIITLPSAEAFAHLREHFHTALVAYFATLENQGWPPEPSEN